MIFYEVSISLGLPLSKVSHWMLPLPCLVRRATVGARPLPAAQTDQAQAAGLAVPRIAAGAEAVKIRS
jgi:hypothetical protein